jgi:hypothetical protein
MRAIVKILRMTTLRLILGLLLLAPSAALALSNAPPTPEQQEHRRQIIYDEIKRGPPFSE